jgi:hypothetical protein
MGMEISDFIIQESIGLFLLIPGGIALLIVSRW